ncbi:Oidioi.mRNA.OKI2018_I69.chr2.g8423.t1.cds [Oikopleura dioica]|uniref:Oidioi.mRNA.OKI2018_I69.chr2.g8423.t1.cds n=1 Tax=Oikopleura dioica TaxID=34765 RepID=A0ABN7TFC7_OIKDI|nr:Oidioi.mRNA.OKI2018_I69.chr2.g8423.t1.cds [Oikopleura dioica]
MLPLTIVSPIIYVIISLIGLIGNGMVVYIFWNKRRGSAVDTLVLNLALADFLYCISLLFMARSLSMNGEWDLGELLCKLTSSWTIICIYASVWLLVALSFDRYFAVCNPVRARNLRSQRNTTRLVICCWVLSCLLALPTFIFRSTKPQNFHIEQMNKSASINSSEVEEEPLKCSWRWPGRSIEVAFYLQKSVFSYILPVLLILLCYGNIIQTLQNVTSMTSARREKINKTILIVVTAFIISWLPNHVFSLYIICIPHEKMSQNINTLLLINSVTQILASSNASMNPFIYAFSRKSVNEEMVRIMTLFCRRLAPVDNRRAHKPHKDEVSSDQSTPIVKGGEQQK